MEEDRASFTALMTAYSRGHHSRYDSPRIFDDFLAHSMLSEDEREAVELLIMAAFRSFNPVGAAAFPDRASALEWLMQASAAAPIVLGRARYAEECLERAIAAGARQYVILGAGLDTFAFRRPDLAAGLRIFEVDHPATQAHKRRRLAELGWELPPPLHFVPVDFMTQRLGAALRASAYDPQLPAFFSWLGVTYYLTAAAVFATLREIAAIAPSGSGLVFDYLDTDAFVPQKAAPRVLRMLGSVRDVGEPMRSGFDPLTLSAELSSLGLHLREDLSPWDIHQRYFLGRTDHYRACEHVHFAHAVVT